MAGVLEEEHDLQIRLREDGLVFVDADEDALTVRNFFERGGTALDLEERLAVDVEWPQVIQLEPTVTKGHLDRRRESFAIDRRRDREVVDGRVMRRDEKLDHAGGHGGACVVWRELWLKLRLRLRLR